MNKNNRIDTIVSSDLSNKNGKLKFAKEYNVDRKIFAIQDHFNLCLNYLFIDYNGLISDEKLLGGTLSDKEEIILGPKASQHYKTLRDFLRFAGSETEDIMNVKKKIVQETTDMSKELKNVLTQGLETITNDLDKAFHFGPYNSELRSLLNLFTMEDEDEYFANNPVPNSELIKKINLNLESKFDSDARRTFSYIVEDRNYSLLRNLHSYIGFLYSATENFFKLIAEHYGVELKNGRNTRFEVVNALKEKDPILSEYINERFYKSDEAKFFHNLRNPLTHHMPNYSVVAVLSNPLSGNDLLTSTGHVSDLLIKINGSDKLINLEDMLIDTYEHVVMGIYDAMHRIVLKDDTEKYKEYLNYLSKSVRKNSFISFTSDNK